MSVVDRWSCEAYGPAPAFADATTWPACFVAPTPADPHCATAAVCAVTMRAERVRLLERIHALADQGDPLFADLAQELTDPDQLLGGPASD